MQTVAIRLYERLKEKIGSEEATLLIDFIDERVKGEVATKEDIHGLDKRISDEVAKLDKRISDEVAKLDKRISDEVAKLDKRISDEVAKLDKRISDEVAKLDKRISDEVAKLSKKISDLEWKMKLYFILLAVLIIITNPNALEFFGKIIGVVK